MTEECYDIVFKGELVRGFELNVAKKNIGQLFKIDGAKLESLFSGKTVVLKRGLNFETANKYRVAIKKAGARVDLVAAKTPTQAVAEKAPPQTKGKAVFGSPSEVAPAVQAETHDAQDEDGFSLAPAGAQLLKPQERKKEVPVNPDVSALSLKQMGGDLLEATEKREFHELDLDLSAMVLAPEGEDLLKDAEKAAAVSVDIDTSALDVAEPGARLGQPAPEPPPAPDVSGITLE